MSETGHWKMGLSPVQQDMYNFLVLFQKENGYMPTMREIGEGKIDGEQVIKKRTSTNSVRQILMCLQERRWIEMMPMRGRSIRLL